MRTFVELVEKYADPELCPYPEYKGKPYYSIKYIENGEEYVGYSTYNLQVMSGFLKKYFMSSAMEKQEQVNTQSVNLTHTTYPNALESLKILESAKDENGCVPMSLVRLAFRNVLEQDRWIPVTERPPEIHKDVFVTDREVSDVYVSYYCGGGYWNTDTGGANNRIIAWRPLPEPYTEDEDEEQKSSN